MRSRADRGRPRLSDRQRRRQEVQRCFAECGLLGGPRGLDPRPETAAAQDGGFGRRLRGALERLGPVFSSFAVYLGSRPDLLPVADCVELAALPDRAQPAPAGAVLERLAAELGREPRDLYAELDETPFESRLLVQAHRATLRNGEPVLVRVVRPGLEAWLEPDLELLDLLADIPGPGPAPDRPLAEAVDDFRQALPDMLDLAAQAAALDALATDAGRLDLIATPRVVRELARPKAITLEWVGGVPLDAALQPGYGKPGPTLLERQQDRLGLARRVAIAWLYRALRGPSFPVEPIAGLVVLAEGRIAFTGGPFASPAALSQSHLWGYLIAAAERDPDRACTYLLREMTGATAAGEEQVRLRLRQVVPFRDGAWTASGDSLAEHLFVHWRLARECGYRPRTHLVAFYRGLFAVAAAARRLAPEQDALAEALQEVRLLTTAGQLRDMMTLTEMRQNLERYAVLMAELPQRLDEVLTRAAAGDGGWAARQARGPEPGGERGSTLLVAAFIAAVAALTLLARQLAGAGLGWAEPAAAAVALLLGGLLLRGLGSGRRRARGDG
jgi:ubiquinone biosynthesis protein